jgi:hypothetical protein
MTSKAGSATAQMKRVYSILADDVEAAGTYGRSNPSEFAHRTLFRTYFALIDGLCYNLRRVSLEYSEANPGLLAAEEIMLLREVRYSLNKKGHPEAVPDHSKTLPNILFSLRCYAKVHEARFEPDTSNVGWAAMQEFVKLRNGLEHPKSEHDLVLSEAQILAASNAARWWRQTAVKLFEVCDETYDKWSSEGA